MKRWRRLRPRCPFAPERGLAYCTFTILRVNTAGKAHMVEFDNPQAIILRGGKEVPVEKTEIEIGDKKVLESRFSMQEDDMCVAFSDGAIHAGGWPDAEFWMAAG